MRRKLRSASASPIDLRTTIGMQRAIGFVESRNDVLKSELATTRARMADYFYKNSEPVRAGEAAQ